MLAGRPIFSDGDLVDGVDIEGDTTTVGGGRIEVGLSYVLDPGAFSSTDPGNYPFDPNDVLMELFFIVEEDDADAEIYNATEESVSCRCPHLYGCSVRHSRCWAGRNAGKREDGIVEDVR